MLVWMVLFWFRDYSLLAVRFDLDQFQRLKPYHLVNQIKNTKKKKQRDFAFDWLWLGFYFMLDSTYMSSVTQS